MLGKIKIYFVSILLLCGINEVVAQDTALYYHNSKMDYAIEPIFDTSFDIFSHHYYNKLRIPSDNFYLKLNNEGSPTENIIFHNQDIYSYARQTNIYEPYIYNPQNVKYYQNRKARTLFSYSNALNGNQFFTINFAKNLYKGLNLQTEYFVNYAEGDFTNSQVMNQFFNFTLNYVSPSGRYYNNLAFIHNRAYTQDNGGISNDSVFINQEYSKPNSYPVSLSQGWNKWKTSEYTFSQAYRIENNKDNSTKILNKGALKHNFSFGRYARLYDDENKAIKDSLGTNILRNSLFWTNRFNSYYSNLFIPITVGVNYDLLNFNDSLQSETYHLVSGEIKTGVLYKQFFLDIHASWFLTDESYKNDYQISIMPKYYFGESKNEDENRGKNFVFAELFLQKRQPNYIFKHYLTENIYWDNEVSKTSTNQLALGLNFNNHLVVSANYFDIKNLYFLSSSTEVHKGNTNIFRLQIQNDFSFGKWRVKGSWNLQKAENEDVLHLPLVAITQGVAYSFTWMKGKLKSQVGIDANYFSSYNADVYNTLLGAFCYQTSQEIGGYVFADAYLNINIDRFCLFVMLQHPYAGLINHKYFSSPLYPAEGFTFRYGITWKLFD